VSDGPELVLVPSVQDLVFQGLATSLRADKNGLTTAASMSREGHDLMGKALIENGRRKRDYNKALSVSRETSVEPVSPASDSWPAWE